MSVFESTNANWCHTTWPSDILTSRHLPGPLLLDLTLHWTPLGLPLDILESILDKPTGPLPLGHMHWTPTLWRPSGHLPLDMANLDPWIIPWTLPLDLPGPYLDTNPWTSQALD